jgi:hypothetical protein
MVGVGREERGKGGMKRHNISVDSYDAKLYIYESVGRQKRLPGRGSTLM